MQNEILGPMEHPF